MNDLAEPAAPTPPAVAAAHALAAITLVGVLVGAFTVGVLGRAAMALLAHLNPVADGVRSDDGFVMGQFTLACSARSGSRSRCSSRCPP